MNFTINVKRVNQPYPVTRPSHACACALQHPSCLRQPVGSPLSCPRPAQALVASAYPAHVLALRCVHMSMAASTWFKARSSTVFMPHALARPHPPAGLAHLLALPVRPANEPNGPPRSLCPAGPALLASAHPALAAPDRPAHTPTYPPHVHSRSFFFGHCINILEKHNHMLVVHRDKEQIKCNKLNKNK